MSNTEPDGGTGGSSGERPLYVVGVDGSDPSIDALVWAIDRAAEAGADIRAVAMWHFPPVSIERPGLARRLHERSTEMLERSVAEARRRSAAGSGVSVTAEVYQYPADLRLIDLSEQADLVVVGRRSRRGLAALGSVSERVASHAHCPVVVIPPRDRRHP